MHIASQMDENSDPNSPYEAYRRPTGFVYTARNRNNNFPTNEQEDATGDSYHVNRVKPYSSEEIWYTEGKKRPMQSLAMDKTRSTYTKGILRKSAFGAQDQRQRGIDSCHRGTDISKVEPALPKTDNHRADNKQAASLNWAPRKRVIGEKADLSPIKVNEETQEKDEGGCKQPDCQRGLNAEIRRVENILIATTNNEVRDWCHQRLRKLSRDLDNPIDAPVAPDQTNIYEIEIPGKMELAGGNLVGKDNFVRSIAGMKVGAVIDVIKKQGAGVILLGLNFEEKSKDGNKKVGETINTVASIVEEQADDISVNLMEAVCNVGSSLESTVDGASGMLGRVIQTVESSVEDKIDKTRDWNSDLREKILSAKSSFNVEVDKVTGASTTFEGDMFDEVIDVGGKLCGVLGKSVDYFDEHNAYQVEAPTNLRGGYQFKAGNGTQIFTATVVSRVTLKILVP